ncbi:SCF ubiquitin ligase complex subunit [Pestalotiopsis sp. IQ-011]
MAYASGSFSSSLRTARANKVLSSLSGLWPNDQQFQPKLVASEPADDDTLRDENPKFQDLMALVDSEGAPGSLGGHDSIDRQSLDAFQNSPIFTSGVDRAIHSKLAPNTDEVIPQYGLVGMQLETTGLPPKDKLVLANMNIPWSAFICGSQGAGKSHTLSCLLESYIDSTCGAGKLPRPLAGLVMHYDNFTNDTTTQLCEAAYLCSSGILVNVLVCPSNIWTMKRLYKSLPGLPPGANRPSVMPLYLTTNQLNISRILKLMAVDPSSEKTPLYMEVVMNIVRQMAMEGPGFAYHEFRRRLTEVKWVAGQEVPLKLRLQLLDTFLAPSALTESNRPAQAEEDIWAFAPGSLTIVDLSDPFMASEDACSLFSICLSIFMEDRGTCGRVVAVDEAHKFLVQTGEARVLTGDLTSIIRQQRHTGTRVIIATQEPTLSPELIDLCNATFVHRFLSPRWYEVLKKHLAAARDHEYQASGSLLETIVTLRTGEALLFCPTAQLDLPVPGESPTVFTPLGNRYAKVQIRKRTTVDGGRSIAAMEPGLKVQNESDVEVPMYLVPQVKKQQTTMHQPMMQQPSMHQPKMQQTTKKQVEKKQTKLSFGANETEKAVLSMPPGLTADRVKKVARRLAKKKCVLVGWGLLKNLDPEQKDQLYCDAEGNLSVNNGDISDTAELRTVFDKEYDAAMKRLNP